MTIFFYNMAPDSKSSECLKITFEDCQKALLQHRLACKIQNISDPAYIFALILENMDEEVADWIITKEITSENFAQKKFEEQILQESKRRRLLKILKEKQRKNENIVDYVKRFIPIIRKFGLDQETLETMLITLAIDTKASELIEKTIKSSTEINWYDPFEFVREIKFNEIEMKKPNTTKQKMKIIYMNQIATNDKDFEIQVRIDDQDYKAIKDRGSNINILSKNIALQHGLPIHKIKEIQLKNIFGNICNINEETMVTLELAGQKIVVNFYIADTEELDTVLIGNQTFIKIEENEIELEKLKQKYQNLFNEEPSEGYPFQECEIKTIPNKKVYIKYRNIPEALMMKTQASLDKLIKSKYVEVSESSWANPIRPVIKPNGEIRITSNMQFLNKLVEDDNYTVPNIQQIIEKTQGKRFFTVIDLKDGYYQISLKKSDRYKTAFYFNNKLYQWTRMPQGFKNSPAIFQRIMDNLLNEEIPKKCSVYLDDIIVYGETEQKHDENLDIVLNKLNKNNFKINPSKMQFKQQTVKILGSITDGNRQYPILEKQKQIQNFSTPKTKKDLQSFLGFANFYNKYIKNHAEIAAPLYDLLKNKSDVITNWNEKSQLAFDKLKNIINDKIAIFLPNFEKEFILSTDASNTGIGAILQQEIEGELKVINWASKKLTPSEMKMGITEKEFLAMMWGIEHFDYYLRGRKFKVITDHTALTASRDKHKFGNIRLERMRERIQQYDFAIEYKKGKDLIDADALSRIYQEEIITESERRNKNVLKGQDNKLYYKINEFEIRELPEITKRQEIIEKVHKEETAHRGRDTIISEIKKSYCWPKLKASVEEFLSTCEECKRNNIKIPGGKIFVSTREPLEIAAIDIFLFDQQTPILTFIDYYTRLARAIPLRNRNSEEIIRALEEIFNEIGSPKKLVSDNGKELIGTDMHKLSQKYNFIHHKVSPERHQSNGRIERWHRELWQALRKSLDENNDKINLKKEISEIIIKHNNSYHRAIHMTPNEAWANPKDSNLIELNSNESKYCTEFNKTYREKFKKNQVVLIKSSEMTRQDKKNHIFEKSGIIKEILDNDSYLIESNGKIIKRNHSSLKA